MTEKKFSKAFIMLILSMILSFGRFLMLQKSSEPNGLDGYYYALQAKSFAETLSLENPSHEIGYYLCGIFAKITGNPINGCKIYSAISSALISLGIFHLLLSLTNSFSSSILGFLISACSPCISSISVNYINNQTGIFFFLFFASLCIRKKLFSCILFFILACISHKVTLIYSLAFFLVFAFVKIYKRNFSEKILSKFGNPFFKISLIVFASFLACIFIMFFSRQLPRFKSSFSFPSLPCFHKSIKNRIGCGAFEMSFFYVSSWTVCFYFLAKAFVLKKYSKEISLMLTVFTLILFFPFWNFDSENDMGYRLFLAAVPIAIVIFIYPFAFFIDSFKSSKLKIASFCFVCISLFLCSIFLTPRTYNPKKDPPYKYYRMVAENLNLPDNSLLIAHLGLNHVYTYYNNLRWSLNYIPDFEVPGGIWRLSYGANKKRIEDVLGLGDLDEIVKLDSRYILIKEDLWQQYLEKEDSDISSTFMNWYNPHTTRPRFIRKPLRK